MNKVAWLKIPTDFFERRTIKRILKERNGDKAALLLILLNILAGAVNDGGYVYITEDLPYEARDLSDMLSVTENAVKNALALLEKYGEIEIYEDGKIMVSAFSMEQNMDSLERYREKARERKRKQRKKEKEEKCHVTVTSRHAIEVEVEEETEIEKETEKEIDTETEKEKETEIETEKDIETDKEKDTEAEGKDISSKPLYFRVINYLNFLTGKNFNPENESFKALIWRWESKGYGMKDFKTVIRNKHYVWKNDVKTQLWLRPQTLFGDKFEEYMNEKPMSSSSYFTVDMLYDLEEEIYTF